MTGRDYEARLQSLVGRALMEGRVAHDPVNAPMIRHWVHAMGDTNPVYVDEEAARATGRTSVVAPPTMLQAWTMRSFEEVQAGNGGSPVAEALAALLEEGGYTSVVATNCEQEYQRELVPGDVIEVAEHITEISPEKTTGLGTGRFVTSTRTYHDQHGEVVGTQLWRLLRFRPGDDTTTPVSDDTGKDDADATPRRPRPAINRDNAFWFEAAREHRLLIQRCADCHTLRHPPGPCCSACLSFSWDTVEASGRGTVYTHTVAHHPRLPAFDYPLPIAVVELVEGTRLIANLVDVDPADISIGMRVELTWVDADPDLSLPAFRPEGA